MRCSSKGNSLLGIYKSNIFFIKFILASSGTSSLVILQVVGDATHQILMRGLFSIALTNGSRMAKLRPALTIEEMEAQLGYKVDAKNNSYGTSALFYSDLTIFVDDSYPRTMREYEILAQGLNRNHELAPAVVPANCEKKV